MAQRTAPTARQQRLGYELRRLREHADLSTTAAAKLLGVTQSRVSNTESARIPVSADRIRTLAYELGCADHQFVDSLAAMATGRSRGWWEEYREILPAFMLDLAEMEHYAAALRSTQVLYLPGHLQTVDYARHVFRSNIPTPSPPLVEFLTSHRVKRQQVLYREAPLPFIAMIHEAALRIRVGDDKVMKEQLKHIAEVSELPHITVLVVPYSAGLMPGSGQTVLYAEGPVPRLDTVQLDTEHGAEFLFSDSQLDKYRTLLERTERMALSPTASRELITSIARSR
ncbi:helix-turn-helix transcriptional regulator [Streptomyces sp. P38-E01]|uniref:Helix-turn-helix transcriptional regulator n=1 Tax=Streptomyces tardus TaxID=2780544 RepID=A0A949JLZ7_9ACTN|nr:helix-turn-helix transcriptional regulator [Streptomyces tardus]MBU7596605.1 helix-turn-helix transcriptional regulator [Streptomyces tardus]